MHIVAIAWMFVVLLMTVAEATSSQGTVLGAFFTLLLYGALPLSIVLYVMGTPGRRRARRAVEAQDAALAAAAEDGAGGAAPPDPTGAASSSADGHRGSQPPTTGVTAERKEP